MRGVIEPSPNDCGITADRNRPPQLVTCRTVKGNKLGLSLPATATLHKDVGRARIRALLVIVVRGPYDGCTAADGNGRTEKIPCTSNSSGELGLLSPGRATSREDISCTSVTVVTICAY